MRVTKNALFSLVAAVIVVAFATPSFGVEAEACDSDFNETKLQLNGDSINEAVIKAEYAVRGPLLLRALEIEEELRSGKSSCKCLQLW